MNVYVLMVHTGSHDDYEERPARVYADKASADAAATAAIAAMKKIVERMQLGGDLVPPGDIGDDAAYIAYDKRLDRILARGALAGLGLDHWNTDAFFSVAEIPFVARERSST